jgi:hypothetical protein
MHGRLDLLPSWTPIRCLFYFSPHSIVPFNSAHPVLSSISFHFSSLLLLDNHLDLLVLVPPILFFLLSRVVQIIPSILHSFPFLFSPLLLLHDHLDLLGRVHVDTLDEGAGLSGAQK